MSYTCPVCGKQGGATATLQAPDGWVWVMRYPHTNGGTRYCSIACTVVALTDGVQKEMEL